MRSPSTGDMPTTHNYHEVVTRKSRSITLPVTLERSIGLGHGSPMDVTSNMQEEQKPVSKLCITHYATCPRHFQRQKISRKKKVHWVTGMFRGLNLGAELWEIFQGQNISNIQGTYDRSRYVLQNYSFTDKERKI